MEATFTKEKLWDMLVAKFAYLNDGNSKAKEVYEMMLSKIKS